MGFGLLPPVAGRFVQLESKGVLVFLFAEVVAKPGDEAEPEFPG